MIGIEAVLVWLAEVIGKKKIGDALQGEARRENRILQRALLESQQRRDELEDLGRLLTEVSFSRKTIA